EAAGGGMGTPPGSTAAYAGVGGLRGNGQGADPRLPAGPAGACCRSKGLCRGWDRPERRTEEQSGRVVAMGPQPRVHPSGVRTWVEEHEPEEGPADAWPAELANKLVFEDQKTPNLKVPRTAQGLQKYILASMI
uniref:SCAN box domain-containing protein n=1 Tax=Oryzias latipes TaxID=8090 RepID=A0A3B3HN35_ORYLA